MIRRVSVILLVFVLYLAVARMSLTLAYLNPSVSPVWPPTGLAFGIVLLLGSWIWPAIFWGAFAVNAMVGELPYWAALSIGAGNTLEALISAWVVRGIGERSPLGSGIGVVRFILSAALSGPVVSATVGTAILLLSGKAPSAETFHLWSTWWLGDFSGLLLVGPMIFVWGTRAEYPWRRRQWAQLALTILAISGSSYFVFGRVVDVSGYSLQYLTLPLLVAAAMKLGQRGATAAVFTMATIFTWNTVHRYGPFVVPNENVALLLLQLFLDTMAATTFILAGFIGERNAQRAKLLEINKELSALFSASPDSYFWINRQGMVENYRAGGSHPTTSFDCVGKKFADLLPPAAASQFNQIGALASGTMPTIEYESLSFGVRRILEARLFSISDARVLAIVRDISEKKFREEELATQAEALGRSNADLERFAYVASHDLQEPIRTIVSFLQLLQRKYARALDAEAEEFIRFTVEAAQRLRSLINSLLEYSRLERQIPMGTVDCQELVDDVLDSLREVVQSSGAKVEVSGLPAVSGNQIQLFQLFLNFVNNAVKFRSNMPPRIEIGANRHGKYWQFYIRDNGIGISPQYHQKIFVLFERLHAQSQYSGTGIGLALCKKIIENHLGTVWLDSDVGKGATFYFTLLDSAYAQDLVS